jgi:hypothetical protein
MTTPLGAVLALLSAAAALAACNMLDPYPTTARSAQTGQPAGTRVGICYNTLTTPLPEVRQQAQRECAADTVAEPVDTDWHLQTCPLLLPARASFVCAVKK